MVTASTRYQTIELWVEYAVLIFLPTLPSVDLEVLRE